MEYLIAAGITALLTLSVTCVYYVIVDILENAFSQRDRRTIDRLRKQLRKERNDLSLWKTACTNLKKELKKHEAEA